ncbi:MAG: hypothetical protein FDZ70_03130, partial [Actinobacteria bacterium]
AGQHGTYFAWDAEETQLRIADCWASLWTDRAFGYRVRQGVAHDAAAMAVIVQRLVPAEAAGAAFTADPVTGARLVTVEACLGIGELLVSGRVTPDRWVFSRPGLETLEAHPGTKAFALFATGSGQVEEVPVPPARATAPALTEDAARDVAALALRAEELLGCPADVEWATESGRLWLLQARPITTAGAAAAAHEGGAAPTVRCPLPRRRPTAWSNVNTGEVLPDVVTPMTWSIVGRLASALILSLFGKLGVRVEPDRLTTLIGGRAYFNATLLGTAFDKMPFVGDSSVTSVFGGMEAPPEMAEVLALPPEDRDIASVSPVRVLAGLPIVAWWLLRHSPARARIFLEQERAATDDELTRIAAAHGEDAVAVVTAAQVARLLGMAESLAFAGVAMASHTRLVSLATKWFRDRGPVLVNTLLAGQGGVASADAGLALARLAADARADAGVAAALRSSPSWTAVRAALDALGTDASAGFLGAWDAFTARHGHHARGEIELAAARWAERPDDVLADVAGLLDAPESRDLIAAYRRRTDEAAEAEAAALARLRPGRRARFARAVAKARDGARVRENMKNEGVRALAATRVALLALGDAMAARSVLARRDDIFFLTWDEVAPVREGSLDARTLVVPRREQYERDRAVMPPPVVIGEWDGAPAAPRPTAGADAAPTLTGLAVASGVARGRARVIRSLQGGGRVLPGEVLVAPFTDPGWTPFFVPAAGIVVDMGGMLSHGSIIAREYGIPAVVNVVDGTSAIRTGDLIEVDGDRGVVTVLERA